MTRRISCRDPISGLDRAIFMALSPKPSEIAFRDHLESSFEMACVAWSSRAGLVPVNRPA